MQVQIGPSHPVQSLNPENQSAPFLGALFFMICRRCIRLCKYCVIQHARGRKRKEECVSLHTTNRWRKDLSPLHTRLKSVGSEQKHAADPVSGVHIPPPTHTHTHLCITHMHTHIYRHSSLYKR